METRNILNHLGQVIGQLQLPVGTSEQEWQRRLSPFAEAPAAPTPHQQVITKIAAYKKECEQLMDYFKADNTLSGITAAQSAELFTNLMVVICALREGALPTAIYLAEQIPPFGFLTQEKKDEWLAEMRSKL
jgi:hypothetical protein